MNHNTIRFEPTPEELRERCLLIQSEWDERERAKRIVDDRLRRQQAGWLPQGARAWCSLPDVHIDGL